MSIVFSFIFWLLLYTFTLFFVLTFLPIIFIYRNPKLVDFATRLWSKTTLLILKKALKIDYRFINLQNIPDEPCIIACKHQSMWETIIFHLIFNQKSPAYVYKKELMKVPFYGWYVKQMPGIKIDRKSGAKGLKEMIKQTKFYLNQNRNIIIFPQGTRTPIGADTKKYPYQVGVAALYKACNVKVVPVALNSGNFWGKKMCIKRSGTIKLEFSPAIEPGLKKEEFMQILEEKIEEKSTELSNA